MLAFRLSTVHCRRGIRTALNPSKSTLLYSFRALSSTPIPPNDSNSTPVPEILPSTADSSSIIPPEYHPFQLLQSVVENVHTTLDIPYWGSIVLCTFAARLLIFPTAVLNFQNMKRYLFANERVQQEVHPRYGDIKQLDANQLGAYKGETLKIYSETGFVPARSFILGILPAPIFISFFFGLQRMVAANPDLATGGAFTFENLAVSDPYYVLPVLNGLLFLAIVESNAEMKKNTQSLVLMRGMSLIVCFAATQFPAVCHHSFSISPEPLSDFLFSHSLSLSLFQY